MPWTGLSGWNACTCAGVRSKASKRPSRTDLLVQLFTWLPTLSNDHLFLTPNSSDRTCPRRLDSVEDFEKMDCVPSNIQLHELLLKIMPYVRHDGNGTFRSAKYKTVGFSLKI